MQSSRIMSTICWRNLWLSPRTNLPRNHVHLAWLYIKWPVMSPPEPSQGCTSHWLTNACELSLAMTHQTTTNITSMPHELPWIKFMRYIWLQRAIHTSPLQRWTTIDNPTHYARLLIDEYHTTTRQSTRRNSNTWHYGTHLHTMTSYMQKRYMCCATQRAGIQIFYKHSDIHLQQGGWKDIFKSK